MLSSIRVRILLAILVFEVVGYGAVAWYNRNASEEALLSVRRDQLDETFDANLARMNNTTDFMESVARSLATTGARFRRLSQQGVDVTPEVQAYLIDTFEQLPSAIGGGLWFEPNAFKASELRYGPYVARDKQQVVAFTWDLNTPQYDYHNQAWYRLAIPAQRPATFQPSAPVVWTEPYRDAAATEALMITVDAYIYDEARRVVGLSTVDWTLDQMQAFVDGIHVTPSTHAFLIDGRQDLIVADPAHPDNVMKPAKEVPWMGQLARGTALNERQVIESIDVDGVPHIVYYARTSSGMLMGVRVPLSEFTAEAVTIARNGSIITASIATFFILLGAAVLHVLFQPFKKVVALIHDATSERDARGELRVKTLTYEAKDEFKGIIGALNQMTTAIRERDDRLAAYAAGLEAKVSERTAELRRRNEEILVRNQEMRLVLDNVNQGLLTLDRAGVIAPERSAVVERWLGPIAPGETFAAVLARRSQKAGDWFGLGFSDVLDGFLPLEVTLSQLLHRVTLDGREFALAYHPILDGAGELERLLVILSDVSAEVEAQKKEEAQRESMALFERIMRDKAGFLEFFTDASSLVQLVAHHPEIPLEITKRSLHTLKGNAGIYGLRSLAGFIHEIEDRIAETERPPSVEERRALEERWEGLKQQMGQWLESPGGGGAVVEVEDREYAAVLEALVEGKSAFEVAMRVQAWKLEPTSRRLKRVAEQAEGVAQRVGKGPIRTILEHNDVRLDSNVFASFWSSMIHVVRNAVDHGLEPAQEREAAGKPREGSLRFATRLEAGQVVVEVADDGRGIAWEKLQAKAEKAGLPSATHHDLVMAIFADGVSTRDEVTELSGRGVGMSAVKESCDALAGQIEVESAPGLGTCFRFRFPLMNLGRGSPLGGPANQPLVAYAA